MKEVLIVDGERCTGCGICELICSMEKMGENNPCKSYIKLLRNRELDMDMITLDPRCDFCNICVEWCPAEVLKFASSEEAAIIRKQNKLGIYPAPSLKGS